MHTHARTNVVIDETLMREALEAAGLKTKREAVDAGLRALIKISRQGEIRKSRGKMTWEGDLEAMRND